MLQLGDSGRVKQKYFSRGEKCDCANRREIAIKIPVSGDDPRQSKPEAGAILTLGGRPRGGLRARSHRDRLALHCRASLSRHFVGKDRADATAFGNEAMTSLPFEKRTASTSRAAEGLVGAPVLVVEDERDLAEEIRLELQASGHPVQLSETVDDGLRAARSGVAVLIIDRMLQGEDGLSIIEALRAEGNATPALVISALSSVDERINGLKAGGDDYLIKPFDIRELTARVEALLRRGGDVRLSRLHAGAIEMDLIKRTVRCDGEPVDLLPREFTLLEYFMRRPGQIVTRAMLLEDVWNFKFMAQTNVVDVQIGNLRRKLDPTGARRFIVNIRAVGFKLNADT
jgi:two-component system, OmpR family, response regulator